MPGYLDHEIFLRSSLNNILSAALLIGLAAVIIAGGILGSLSLLVHFGVLGARSGPPFPL